MDPQIISLYATLVYAITKKMRPVVRYPIVFSGTIAIFLIGFLIANLFKGSFREAWVSTAWFFLTEKGGLMLTAIGTFGVFCVWIVYLFNPSDEEAERAAKKANQGSE